MLKGLTIDAWFHLRECFLLSSSLMVSVLAGLLYFHIKGKEVSRRFKITLVYIFLGLSLLICPVTASLLRLATGVYYDSQDIWNILPLIPLGALMSTLLITELVTQKDELRKGTCIIAALCLAAAVLVCGSLGKEYVSAATGPEEISESEKQVAEFVCDQFADMYTSDNGDISEIGNSASGGAATIFAPDTITAYVHIYTGKVRTLYGRDMWDGRLTKNRFGNYSDEVRELYEDMKKIMAGNMDNTSETCRKAFELGADICIMPGYCREALSEDSALLTEEFISSDGTEFILVKIQS